MKIDEIDIKILRTLRRDARTSLKDIAKDCGISTPAAAKRIEKLKKTGIITGTRIFTSWETRGYSLAAMIAANVGYAHKSEVVQSIKKNTDMANSYLTGCFQCIGYYDVIVGILAKNINELDKIRHFVEGLPGVKTVQVHIFLGQLYYTRGNIVLQPKEV